MHRANESYWYREAGVSQQACAISSEASSRPSCWNVEGVYSNLSCTVVVEEGRQKSKRLSYTEKVQTWSYSVRREGKPHSRCNFWSWWRQRSTVAETRDSDQRVWGFKKGNSLDPRKDDFLKLMMESSCFFKINDCFLYPFSVHVVTFNFITNLMHLFNP